MSKDDKSEVDIGGAKEDNKTEEKKPAQLDESQKSTKQKALERFNKIFDRDFMQRIDEIGAEDVKWVHTELVAHLGQENIDKDPEILHKLIVPKMIPFYQRLLKDEKQRLGRTKNSEEKKVIQKNIKGFKNYITVLEVYKSELGGKKCIVM